MQHAQAACPHCGYDFPPPPERPDRTWQILLIGAIVVGMSVWGLWDHPIVAAIAGVCGVMFFLGLAFKLWRLIRDW
jgi:hypothetical protein